MLVTWQRSLQWIAGIIAVPNAALAIINYTSTNKKIRAKTLKELVDEFSEDKIHHAVKEITSQQREFKQKDPNGNFAAHWANAVQKKEEWALQVDQHRRDWLLFWNKFKIYYEHGMIDGYTDRLLGKGVINTFPGASRAKTFVEFNESLDDANCQIVMGKTEKECATEYKSAVYVFLRALYKI